MLRDSKILGPGCGIDGPHLTQSHHLGKWVSLNRKMLVKKRKGVHAHVYVCTCRYVCMRVEAWVDARLCSVAFYFIYWDRISFWSLNSTSLPTRVFQFAQGLCFLNTGITGHHHAGLAFILILGCKLKSSCLWNRCLTHWSTSQVPVWYFSTRILIMCWTSQVTVLSFPYHCFVVGTIQLHYPN